LKQFLEHIQFPIIGNEFSDNGTAARFMPDIKTKGIDVDKLIPYLLTNLHGKDVY